MKYRSLSQLKHEVITPLQEAWQSRQVLKRFPHMEATVKAYREIYPYVGASTSVSVNERMAKGIEDDTLTYGETRWHSFLKLLDHIEISSRDRFVDLGCGAGFLCFLMAQGYGVPALGVDLIEGFIQNAQQISDRLQLNQPRFQRTNFFDLEFLPFSILYATCTCFPDEVVEQLAQKMETTAPGTRIITVTNPIEAPYLRQLKHFKLKYDWGLDYVFVAERKS